MEEDDDDDDDDDDDEVTKSFSNTFRVVQEDKEAATAVK